MIRVNPCPNGIRDIFFLNECKEKVIGIFHHLNSISVNFWFGIIEIDSHFNT